MRSEAMYVGRKSVNYPAKVNENGEKLDAVKGTYYAFFAADWDGEDLEDLYGGRTYRQFVPDGEEPPKLEFGEVYLIKITNMEKYQCKVVFE